MTTLPRTKNALIYYYCSDEAFRSIIKSRTLRLTNIFQLNDTSEFIWAHQQLRRHAEEFAREYEGVGVGSIDAAFRVACKGETDISVVCFSPDDDDLSQWRGYGDNARGVAIGFDSVYLLQECATDFSLSPGFQGNVLAGNVLYVNDNADILAPNEIAGTNLLEYFRTSYDEYSVVACPRDKDAPFRSFVDNLLTTACLVKHEAFSAEKEWRIIYHSFNPGKGGHPDAPDDERALCTFRRPDGRHVRYYAFPFVLEYAIKSIRLGPNHPEKGCHIGLREFLRKEGVRDEAEILDSRIPYR